MRIFIIPAGRSTTAMALWPVILINRKLRGKPLSAELINHERIHHRQQLEMLLLLFYLWYCSEFLVRYLKYRNWNQAYRNISFEREAYTHEHNLNYLDTRKLWSFINLSLN
ncbi:hypothetical protein FW774_10155 [Pedobacter sp. BS3]|uniref:hypothetical protein n=1 Tax=Pedobacter sp. BS3 TaxID=2567937 RepID=UPI0011ED537F|nr:hypothetical protein [Pedobacter sp. BS3]TZF83819.1 hypothetical protein FW774_10155 [Pedobacter sp. BS3]